MHTFKISAPIDSCHASIEMDGKRLEGVTAARFEFRGGGGITKIDLSIWGEVNIDGEFRETDIIRVRRDDAITLRSKIRVAFLQTFPMMEENYVEAMVEKAMSSIEQTVS